MEYLIDESKEDGNSRVGAEDLHCRDGSDGADSEGKNIWKKEMIICTNFRENPSHENFPHQVKEMTS